MGTHVELSILRSEIEKDRQHMRSFRLETERQSAELIGHLGTLVKTTKEIISRANAQSLVPMLGQQSVIAGVQCDAAINGSTCSVILPGITGTEQFSDAHK